MKKISKLLVVVCFLGLVDAKAVQPPSVSLFEAARLGYQDAVERHIDAKSFINDRDIWGATPLHYAAEFNREKIVKLLAMNGGDVNARDKEGRSPIHYASRTAADKAIKELIKQGVKQTAKCNLGFTSLAYLFYPNEFTGIVEKNAKDKIVINITGLMRAPDFKTRLIEQKKYVEQSLFKAYEEILNIYISNSELVQATTRFNIGYGVDSYEESGFTRDGYTYFQRIISNLKEETLEQFLNSEILTVIPNFKPINGRSYNIADSRKGKIKDLPSFFIARNNLETNPFLIIEVQKAEATGTQQDEAKRQPHTQKVKAQQAAAERARQAEAKRQAALKQSLNKLDSKLSGRTSVNVPQGRYSITNYESLIRRKYVDATIHPGTISGDPVVKVQLVIARNGNVISARIIGTSGLASWDRAVQKALDRVKRIAPFPAGMSGTKKTFNLNFNSRSFQ